MIQSDRARMIVHPCAFISITRIRQRDGEEEEEEETEGAVEQMIHGHP